MADIKIATRSSKLALTQSNYVKQLIENLCPDAEISLVNISTTGDRDKSDFLYKTTAMGFFTTEVENALLDSRADVAVHSLKDLPTGQRDNLIVAAIPARQNPADVLIANPAVSSLDQLVPSATVGTSSLRRIAQLKHLRPDLNCVPLRGNIETRINKVMTNQLDAIIIAAAGVNRLEMQNKISAELNPTDFLPAPAQGALAVQIRNDNPALAEIIKQLDNKNARITAETERHILAAMKGGCSIPLGAHAAIEDNKITITAMIADPSGQKHITQKQTCQIEDRLDCAEKIANQLLNKGGKQILEKIRNQRTQS